MTERSMRQKSGSESSRGVLTPDIPLDIGRRTQRQRILDAMASSCAEKTFARATIADIVSKAGISRATFYKHFENKHACLDAAVTSFMTELEQTAIEAYADADSQTDGIRRAIAAILELMADNEEQAKLVVLGAPVVDPTILGRYRDAATQALGSQVQASKRGPHSKADAKLAFGRAFVAVADYLAAGRVRELPSLRPEIVYAALLPFVGHEEALAQDKLAR